MIVHEHKYSLKELKKAVGHLPVGLWPYNISPSPQLSICVSIDYEPGISIAR